MAWTSDDLALDVRARAQLPAAASDGSLSDAELLSIADEEIATRLVPFVRDVGEDFWVQQKDYAVSTSVTSFILPKRAQSGVLRDVLLVEDSTGDTCSLVRVNLEDVWMYDTGSSGAATRFYLRDGRIYLVGHIPSSGYSLRLVFFRRHPALVATSSCAQVTGVTTNVVTATAGIFTTGDEVDGVGANPPFVAFGDNLTATVSGTSHTLVDEDAVAYDIEAQGLAAGDWLCPADQSCIIQIPTELYSALVRLVVGAILESRGDRQAAAMSYQVADQIMGRLVTVLRPRVTGEPKRIVVRNSPLRLRARSRW